MILEAGGVSTKAGAAYLFSTYREPDPVSGYYLMLEDFYIRLQHPKVKKALDLREQWDTKLSFSKIAAEGVRHGCPKHQVYVDVVPILTSAMRRVASWLASAKVPAVKYDGKAFLDHFAKLSPIALSHPLFEEVRLPLWLWNPGKSPL